ncbi:MAG: MFS transporter [Oxalobacteraceae bacterium]|nr:MFS transporter [Oxalobacteraceae bacterium]
MPQSAYPHAAASGGLKNNVTFQVVATVFFTFICYLTIGIPLAVLPGYVHFDLGFSAILSGLAISMQYLATLSSRPYAGHMADSVGSKQTVMIGLAACGASGVLMMLSAACSDAPRLGLAALLLGRLALGFGESWVATGAITWGIGRVGIENAARVLSLNGIASYGALAVGAPLGVVIERSGGFSAIGITVAALGLAGLAIAAFRAPTAIVRGEKLAFRHVLRRVLPHGICQALGSVGFGVIASFITLFYAAHHWANAALALTVFGTAFVVVRLLFAHTINRFGGFPVAIVSFAVECAGLLLLWQAGLPQWALAGAALTGAGFALIFPALALEAVGLVAAPSRGAALGAYSLFLDLSLWITGPVAGLIAAQFSYAEVFLFAALAAAAAMLLSIALYLRSDGGSGK